MLRRCLATGCVHTIQSIVIGILDGDRCVGGVISALAVMNEEQAMVGIIVADTLSGIRTALTRLGTDVLRSVGVRGLRASSSVRECVHGSYVAGYEADVRF